jgi:selenocysteine lyase/cysteine desulfurase
MDVDALRALTPGCAHRVHLNNAGAGLLAQPTIDAMTAHLQLEAEIGGYEAAAAKQDEIAGVYGTLAELVNGSADEIALFDNATHAWGAAFYSIPLGPGDRILTGRAEYGSNVLAYLQVAQRTGAEVVVVPNDEYGQLDVTALAGLVDERTKVIGVTHVPTSGGLVNPAARIGRIAQQAGVPFLLDATQSVGQFPLDVEALGCDLLTGTGRKFLRGPRGTGFLWVRSSLLDRLDPFVIEIESATWDGKRGFTWVPGAHRFATWENSYLNVLGLGSAVRQALDLGLDTIGERARILGARLRAQLGGLPDVTAHDLGEVRCAIVTISVDGIPADAVQTALARAGINVTTTTPSHTQFDAEDRGLPSLVRLSPHYYNTEDELDRTVETVAALADDLKR